MAADGDAGMSPVDAALAPMAPGELIHIGCEGLHVVMAPAAGGRVAQIRHDGVEWLVGHDDQPAMIAWGCYPMVPFAGRIRHGCFGLDGVPYVLPPNLGPHAIHGVGFALPWRVEAHGLRELELSLDLPADARWLFGGHVRQRLEVTAHALRMMLTVTAGEHGMPVTMGWHPWFRKPDRLDFAPERAYPRDDEGIACLPLIDPPPPPWDDCFINRRPVALHRAGQCLRLSSNCDHWVVYDETAHATCVEPQSGPPDAVNLGVAKYLAPGESISAWFALEWLPPGSEQATR